MQSTDYNISFSSPNFFAIPRSNSGLPVISGTDSFTVINSALVNIKYRGHIHLSAGTFDLSDELVIIGTEDSQPTLSQLMFTGEGFETNVIQNTSGKNALVVKNKASIMFRDFYVYVGANSKSGILLDDTGAKWNMSVFGGTIDNVMVQSSSTNFPAVYLKNFFDLNVPRLSVTSANNHGIVIENTSNTTNYGNSNFGFIRSLASRSAPFAGLAIRTTQNNNFPNLMSFANYQCMAGYYGLYMKGAKFNTFQKVDIEATTKAIFLDGSANGDESRYNDILSGYLLVNGSDTAITATVYSGGNNLHCTIDGGNTSTPILDQSNYRPPNVYDIILGGDSVANINITNIANTELKVRKVDGNWKIKLPVG